MVIGSYYVNYHNYQNLMLLTSSDTKWTLMHLFLFTNSAQRELVLICTQSLRNAINFPCIITLLQTTNISKGKLELAKGFINMNLKPVLKAEWDSC